MSNFSTNKIYENYSVLHPDGTLMFRCGIKKFRWYVNKGLADIINPKTIRLTFIPNGKGYQGHKFYLQYRENKCAVCGTEKDLSKHHVVPYCYRKFFPKDLKNHNYHDVLPLCISCHTRYEIEHSVKRREYLARIYHAPIQGAVTKPDINIDTRAIKNAFALIHYGSSIPISRKQVMMEQISDSLKGNIPTPEKIKELSEIGPLINCQSKYYKTHGLLVMEHIRDLQSFVEDWRRHFVNRMKPEYLPIGWDQEQDIYSHLKEGFSGTKNP